jgi:hypothetical protein
MKVKELKHILNLLDNNLTIYALTKDGLKTIDEKSISIEYMDYEQERPVLMVDLNDEKCYNTFKGE